MQRSSFSLRLKFALWSLLVFLAVYLAASGGWLAVMRTRADADLERTLRETVRRAGERIVREGLDPADPRHARAIREGLADDWGFVRSAVLVRAADGAVLARAPQEGALSAVEPELSTQDGAGQLAELDVDLGEGRSQHLRAVAEQFVTEPGTRFWLQVASERPDVLSQGRAAWLVLISALIGILAAAAMAWIMGGRIVRPIQRMATAARSVSPSNLRGRIDVEPIDSEIARLQKELNDALERMERGYRAQGQFLSNVSHELKTPVAVMLSQAQLLRSGGSAEEMAQFAANVEDEMRTMGRLVESLLLLARVEHGKELVRQESMPINDVVLEAAERTSELSRSLDVPLVTNLHLPADGESEPEIVGDPELVRTMVENLVRNALRFTPAGEPVDLRVACRQGEASIRVRDRGPGIPKEHLERIFERFYQVPGEGGKQRGTGLGLAIARSVAELHEGRIAVRNLPEQGCEFEVRLPLKRPEAAPRGGKRAKARKAGAAPKGGAPGAKQG